MKLIISPHPDDELIACMSQLTGSRIIQVFAFENRMIEFLELANELNDFEYNVVDDLDELVKLCANAKELFIPSPSDLNIEHKWISNYILKNTVFNDSTTVYMYSYNYLFPIKDTPLPTVRFEVNISRKIDLVRKYYKSQYLALKECGLLDGLKNYEEFAIFKLSCKRNPFLLGGDEFCQTKII